MATSAFRIHGAGHGVADSIFTDIDFNSMEARPFHSRLPGDGGLSMGQLVNKSDFQNFAHCTWESALKKIALPQEPLFNAGGPALVALTAAAQFLKPVKIPVTYYGVSGDDTAASELRHLLAQTPLDFTCYRQRNGQTPTTTVGVDPSAHNGQGDRFFVHDPGTVSCDPSFLGESFFQATINVYAGTAPLPALHQALPSLLAKGRHRGALNIVATVFDFEAEKKSSILPWTLGSDEAYPEIDLLVSNQIEICRLSGQENIEKAIDLLMEKGLSAAIVTQGSGPVYYCSRGGVFGQSRGFLDVPPELTTLVKEADSKSSDSVGAGDNFLGGVLADLLMQILADDFYPKGEIHVERELLQICPLRLRHAIEFGIVSGALACLHRGGLKVESSKGERLALVRKFFPDSTPAGRPW